MKAVKTSQCGVVSLLAVLALLGVLPVASASAMGPWWQVSTGSRPTNLWLPADEVQELVGGVGATVVKVKGTQVACFAPAAGACAFTPPYTGALTVENLRTALEAPAAYGPGNVEVTEPSSGRFLLTAINGAGGRWVPPLETSGSGASSKVLTEGGSGRLVLTITNVGDAPAQGSKSTIVVTDRLPEGVTAHQVEAFAGGQQSVNLPSYLGPVICTINSATVVSCSFSGDLPSYEAIEVEIAVSLTSNPPVSSVAGEVTVSGGRAPTASAIQPLTIGEADTSFGIESFSMQVEEEGGAKATQAGSHPFQLTTSFQLNSGRFRPGNRRNRVQEQPALPRNFRFKLPAGLVGNAQAVPQCTYEKLTAHTNFISECPAASAIGVASVTIIENANFGLVRMAVPVFNLEPSFGEPARFGFLVAGVPVVINTAVRSGDGYGVTAIVSNASQIAQVLAGTVTIWGVPGDPRHDGSRGWSCAYHFVSLACEPRPDGLEARPFLRLPTACSGPLRFAMELEPWNVALGSVVLHAASTGVPLDRCNRVPFEPRILVEPGTEFADTPSGLTVHLQVPQESSESPGGVAESDVRKTVVTLPAGLRVNSAAADSLQTCSEAQIGFQRIDSQTGEAIFDEAPASCPEASKLGKVKITTPLLEEPVTGWVYQAAQGANPFHSLLALYVVAEAPKSGIRVKLAGKVEANRQTGQLVSTFDATPQLPFEEFELSIFGGAGAPLATSGCGIYKTETEIEPWSGGPAATPSSQFEVTSGPDGSLCQAPEPFSPSFGAGTEVPLAGAYSPFLLRLGRADGTQRISVIDTVLPSGLSGRLAGVATCKDGDLAAAAAKTGIAEQRSASCPAASRVGVVRVGAGVGPNPIFVRGTAYLAGPYKGAPLSLAIVTPAVAGPFDLGTVLVRAALFVDPVTAQIRAVSDPIPQMLEGIPLNVRSIALRMDRQNFTLNPTSCEEMSIRGQASSAQGAVAPLHNRFQVGGCRGLAFKPRLGLRLKGGTKRGKHPKLIANLRAGEGGANISRASVKLPRSAFLDQSHIGTVCTRVQWAQDACPARSVYGRAWAKSPLLDYWLTGKVYLRSSSNKLPDLVADLRGPAHQPIRIELVGRTDSVKGALRNTFAAVPDAPVSRFRLELFGGKRGLVVNSADLCRGNHRANVKLDAHNGMVDDFRPVVRNDCGKKKRRAQESARHKWPAGRLPSDRPRSARRLR